MNDFANRGVGIIVGGVVLVAILVAGWAFVSFGQQEVPSTPIAEVSDGSTIQSSAQLSHLSIATSENFARQKIYVISAYLKNISDKPLRMAEVKMTFEDFDGKTIREYSQKVLEKNQKPVQPGTDFRFEVRQENLPRGWNYRVPMTEITKLGY
jgi:FtsZ-interacting cell division protein ZipA